MRTVSAAAAVVVVMKVVLMTFPGIGRELVLVVVVIIYTNSDFSTSPTSDTDLMQGIFHELVRYT